MVVVVLQIYVLKDYLMMKYRSRLKVVKDASSCNRKKLVRELNDCLRSFFWTYFKYFV